MSTNLIINSPYYSSECTLDNIKSAQTKEKTNSYDAYTNASTKEDAQIALGDLCSDMNAITKKLKDLEKACEEITSKPKKYNKFEIALAKLKTTFAQKTSEVGDYCTNSVMNDYFENWNIETYGQIKPSNQRYIGDCWLLSGLNAFIYNENGAEFLEENISYDEQNHKYTVDLKGADKIEITEREVYEARKAGKHTKNDNRILVYELAFEKFLADTPAGKEKIENGYSSIHGGALSKFTKILTGKESTVYYDKFNDFYEVYKKNPQNYSAALGFINEDGQDGKQAAIKDINGNYVAVCSGNEGHMWALKSIEEDILTCVDPANVNSEVKFTKEEVEKYLKEIDVFKWNSHNLTTEKTDSSDTDINCNSGSDSAS